MTNRDLKKAVRTRMAETGEKYTTALRAIQNDRSHPDAANIVPVSSRVSYRGGIWVVRAYNDLTQRQDLTPQEIEQHYPDGVGYELWPEDVPYKFGERSHAMYYVRRSSFEVLEEEISETDNKEDNA